MNTSIVFLIIVALGGLICILSSLYEWTWFWRLSGLSSLFYKRFGHEATRVSYGFGGVLLLVLASRELIVLVWITTWGKVFVVTLVLLAASFTYFARGSSGAKFKEKRKKHVDENTDTDIDSVA